jgi:hypothetical protein
LFPTYLPAAREEQALPIVYGGPDHWLKRAREARAMAAQIDDRAARQAMLEIATNYEKIAKRAEAREAGVDMPKFHPHNQ